jgi:hypothetical protein
MCGFGRLGAEDGDCLMTRYLVLYYELNEQRCILVRVCFADLVCLSSLGKRPLHALFALKEADLFPNQMTPPQPGVAPLV